MLILKKGWLILSNNNRIESLDSLRGLASLSVVFNHILLVLPVFFLALDHHKVDNWTATLLTKTPLHIFWAGHEAVLLFFVLSGFVLALPFLNSKNGTYPKYLIKRFCRIYIPYIVSIGVAVILFYTINPSDIVELSAFFNNQWDHNVSILSAISFIFLLGYDNFNINGSTWSLVHELRISIIFPLLMILVIKFNWKKSLLFGIGASIFLWAFTLLVANVLDIKSVYILLTSFADTFYYASFFIIGATLAKYHKNVIAFTKNLKLKVKIIALIAFVLLYNVEWISLGFGDMKFSNSTIVLRTSTLLLDFIIAGAIVILFSLVLSLEKLKTILTSKPLIGLGKISYSLYLIHISVLLTMLHTLHAYLPLPLILATVPVLSIIAAIVFYLFVEKPSMQLGKYLTSKRIAKSSNRIEVEAKRA
jgi:peptidoglycan/LPS O-acetylase OafA/YrhL